jgi:hypothetical protein
MCAKPQLQAYDHNITNILLKTYRRWNNQNTGFNKAVTTWSASWNKSSSKPHTLIVKSVIKSS